MAGCLDGIRVFDLTVAGAGPLASRILAEFGAEVIKIEAPGDRDPMHSRPPRQRGLSVGYSHFNRGKKSAVFDLRDENDRQAAYELLQRCDVFVNNMRPGVAERLGLGYEELNRINPRLIYGYLSAWGRKGPLALIPGADPVVQFFSGWCSIQGEEGGSGEFLRHVGHLDASGAMQLAGGIVLGLIYRELTGRGLRVDVSLLKSTLAIQITRLAEYFGGRAPRPMGSGCATTVPHQAFLCSDGKYLAVGVVHDGHWRGLCEALGLENTIDDPRFRTNPLRVEHREELIPFLAETFKRWPTNWWEILLTRHGVPHNRFYDWENIKYHTQVRDNNFISEVNYPHQGRLFLANPPWKMGEFGQPSLLSPWPGQHTEEVRAWLRAERQEPAAHELPTGAGREREPERAGDGATPRSPRSLSGLTVVDATQGLCGPYTSLLLADAGATVIKVEPPEGDYARQIGPPFPGGESAVFLALNRNKESIVLDWTNEAGRAALARLIEKADIFLEDWGPGKAEELGLGYEELRARSPRLIYGAISPFGEQGPMRDRPGSELTIQAVAEYQNGIGVYNGPPMRTGADIANTNAAAAALCALSVAVYHRIRTGRGQRVAIAQYGALLYARGTIWASQGDPEQWDGWAARTFAPPEYGYQAKDGRIYFFILRGDEEQFDRLMIELGLEEYLADPRFGGGGRDSVGIGRYGGEVRPIWEAVFKERTVAELAELAARYGAVVVPLHDYESLFADVRTAPLDLVGEIDHPRLGKYRSLGLPWDFSPFDDGLGAPPHDLGQDTEEVLRRFGFADGEIRALTRAHPQSAPLLM